MGMAFWGSGGTNEEMKDLALGGVKYRVTSSDPYILTESACRDVARSLGLEEGGNGFSFSGNYGTKGCYAYSSGTYMGMAFWGSGGTNEEMKDLALGNVKYRLTCI